MRSNKDTKQRILDAAEGLFAKEGYHNASLRSITTKAKVNLAAVNYHFGSKDGLMTSVLERRLLPLNALRLKRLEEVAESAKAEKRPPRAKDILFAFIEPTLKFKESSSGAQNFITLIGRALTEPNDPVRAKFIELIGPVFHRLFGLLREALPHTPKEVLLVRLFFSMGGLSHAMMMNGRWPSPSDHVEIVCDAQTLIDQLVPFITAGMEAPI